jgi:hypothetical protein
MEIEKPNLFSFATSELSQDAFICWLASWADPKFAELDALLHKTAQDFVKSLILKCKTAVPSIETIEVRRQIDRIDILIFVNKGDENRLAILVEDKTFTSNHSDQLSKYYVIVHKEYGYSEEEIIPLYFKTGYQSRFEIGDKYKTYLRKDLLKILREGESHGINNAIFCDFLHSLEGMESAVLQFTSKKEWTDIDWMGFFLALYEKKNELETENNSNWGKVVNSAGSFYGFWWYFTEVNKEYRVYIQLEYQKLCFKIEILTNERHKDIRNQAVNEIETAITSLNIKGFSMEKTRMKIGKTMTIMRLIDDYRFFDINGRIDMNKTIEKLRDAEQVFDQALIKLN